MRSLSPRDAIYGKGELLRLPGSWKRYSVSWAAAEYRRYPGFSLLIQELLLPRFSLFSCCVQCEGELAMQVSSPKTTIAIACKFPGSPGTDRYGLFYFPEGQSDLVLLPGTTEILLLDIEHSWLDGLSEQFPDIRILLEAFDRSSDDPVALALLNMNYFAAAITRNIKTCGATGGELRLQMEKYLLELLSEYVKQLRQKEDEKRLPFAAHRPAIVRIREAIMQAPNVNEHTISALARSAGLSETALKKNFRILFGEPVAVFVRRHALEKARYLLETTTRRIDDIADEVGYSSFTNFATPFRKAFGCTPRQLRDKQVVSPKGSERAR